jgi:pyruvate formate lyase activating enzyme
MLLRKDIVGRVLRIEKTSIHDGLALRTVVFLKGCPLKCKWCSTPESQNMKIKNEYGKDMTVSEVVSEISKDEIFFFHSNGGVTISGGEVLLQADFAAEVLKECKLRGIDTAIETSLYSDFIEVEKLLPYLDSLYVDLKIMNEEIHNIWTGVSNSKILDNLYKVDKSSYDIDIHVRIPMIPTLNMTKENLSSTLEFCKTIGKLKDVELLPYHRLGMDTYRKLGKEYELKHIETPSDPVLYYWAEFMSDYARKIKIIINSKEFLKDAEI